MDNKDCETTQDNVLRLTRTTEVSGKQSEILSKNDIMRRIIQVLKYYYGSTRIMISRVDSKMKQYFQITTSTSTVVLMVQYAVPNLRRKHDMWC